MTVYTFKKSLEVVHTTNNKIYRKNITHLYNLFLKSDPNHQEERAPNITNTITVL